MSEGRSANGSATARGASAPVGIDELLERVRGGYDRIGPPEAAAAASGGALLVDIRYAALRDRDGLVPGAMAVERNELEWRLDPHGSHRAAEAVGHDLRVVVIPATRVTPPASRSPRRGSWDRTGPRT